MSLYRELIGAFAVVVLTRKANLEMQQMDKRLSKGIGSSPGLQSDAIQDGVALKLKELYNNLESEVVPDRLLDLLDKLERAEKAHSGMGKAEDTSNG